MNDFTDFDGPDTVRQILSSRLWIELSKGVNNPTASKWEKTGTLWLSSSLSKLNSNQPAFSKINWNPRESIRIYSKSTSSTAFFDVCVSTSPQSCFCVCISEHTKYSVEYANSTHSTQRTGSPYAPTSRGLEVKITIFCIFFRAYKSISFKLFIYHLDRLSAWKNHFKKWSLLGILLVANRDRAEN